MFRPVSCSIAIGDGGFHAAVSYAVGSSPFAVAVGDLNGDRKLDRAVTNANLTLRRTSDIFWPTVSGWHPREFTFLKQAESKRVTESVECLHRAAPYEVFICDVQADLDSPVETGAEQTVQVMYRGLLREMDYAEDFDISELEIELEKKGNLAAFQELCRAEYKEEWRKLRNGGGNFGRVSALLHCSIPRLTLRWTRG